MEQTHMKGCLCSDCKKSQFRNLGNTWVYPEGSISPADWNYFSTVGYNYGGKYTPPLVQPDVQTPMVYVKENYCNSCSAIPFKNLDHVWTYQPPYSS